ncbi:MAG: hypothetical protein J0H50_01905 [Xanthomonadales bacterium]|nr:hypothetical protein [Xanthomonadales bacterium]
MHRFRTGIRAAVAALAIGTGALLLAACSQHQAEQKAGPVPTPASVLGHTPGDDYYLADYEDSLKYFHALAKASDHIRMVATGKSSEGRTFEYAIISIPENLAKFDQYVDASKQLADGRQLSDAQARDLARTSKIIVHIDGGLHAAELGNAQLPPLLAYKLLSEPNDPEVARIMRDAIVILWPTLNPDGMDMQVHWYREQLQRRGGKDSAIPTGFVDQPMPYVYQKYVSHDNNRDGYMLNMVESQVVMAEQQKNAPAIWYTHHQPGDRVFPPRIWVPPFSDPVSANIDPLVRMWTTNIGIDMLTRFGEEGKPGALAQNDYDNWYPGYIDYMAEFRHTPAYFTETTHATPTPIDYRADTFPREWSDLKPLIFYSMPWQGGVWHFRDTENYMLTASMATLMTAVNRREEILYDRYLAATRTARRYVDQGLHAYVIPAGQADPQSAALLAQKLIQQGVEVYRNKAALTLGDTLVPAGSWVVRMDQPFAGLVEELFGLQQYPHAFLDKDGLPKKLPYDVTGWTLPLQFGVDAVAIKTPLPASIDGSLERVTEARTAGGLQGHGAAYAVSQASNASYKVANAVLEAKGKVAFAAGKDGQAPSMVLSKIDDKTLGDILNREGVTATPVAGDPPTGSQVSMARVGNYRPWGQDEAAMDAGWTQWLLEQYGFNPKELYNADIRAGNLRSKVDVIVLPDMVGRGQQPTQRLVDGPYQSGSMPEKYSGGINREGVDALKAFVNAGGTLVAMDHSANAVIDLFDLPVSNALGGLTPTEFYCAGALFAVDLGQPSSLTVGVRQQPSVMFFNSPAFSVKPGFQGKVLASYAKDGSSLQSGFALHPERLQGLAAALEVSYGKGRVVLYGFAPQFRGQSQGTFKLLFNALYLH